MTPPRSRPSQIWAQYHNHRPCQYTNTLSHLVNTLTPSSNVPFVEATIHPLSNTQSASPPTNGNQRERTVASSQMSGVQRALGRTPSHLMPTNISGRVSRGDSSMKVGPAWKRPTGFPTFTSGTSSALTSPRYLPRIVAARDHPPPQFPEHPRSTSYPVDSRVIHTLIHSGRVVLIRTVPSCLSAESLYVPATVHLNMYISHPVDAPCIYRLPRGVRSVYRRIPGYGGGIDAHAVLIFQHC